MQVFTEKTLISSRPATRQDVIYTATMTGLSKVNKDIKEERDKVSFSIEEFTNWYHGGADAVKEKRFLGERSFLDCFK